MNRIELDKLEKAIIQWGRARGIDKAHPQAQMNKVVEEVGEIAKGLNRHDLHTIKDGIGDAFVTLVMLAETLKLDFTDCINLAYDQIKDRDGVMVNGIFVKEEDL